ncbi:MAG: hypothetical protein ACI86H_001738 [bacterium]|jgi:hypothetical protein
MDTFRTKLIPDLASKSPKSKVQEISSTASFQRQLDYFLFQGNSSQAKTANASSKKKEVPAIASSNLGVLVELRSVT